MILIMGVAGAGKSVQGKLLADKLGYKWLSSGEILRQFITGEKRQQMLAGKLLSDQEMIEIVGNMLEHVHEDHDTILDGFPRTLSQAEWLLEQHKQKKLDLESVILLKVSTEVVRKRLLARGRPDDNEEALLSRFNEYEQMTLPIIDLYRKNGIKIHEIDGHRAIESISSEIIKQLGTDSQG